MVSTRRRIKKSTNFFFKKKFKKNSKRQKKRVVEKKSFFSETSKVPKVLFLKHHQHWFPQKKNKNMPTCPMPFTSQWDCIPQERLKDHLRFYKTTRKEHSAPHWTRDIMITTLHSFYCRSSGMYPNNVAELDFFWKTGNIPTRNLHLLQPQTFVPTEQTKHNRCALCTIPFVKDDMVYKLPCGDRFHVTHDSVSRTDTIKNLLRNDNQCPCCCARVVLSDKG